MPSHGWSALSKSPKLPFPNSPPRLFVIKLPLHTQNVTVIPTQNDNGCLSNSIIKPHQRSGGGFEQALAQYGEWNATYEYWLTKAIELCGENNSYDLMLLRSYGLENEECSTLWDNVSHFSALKDNYFNAIIVAAMNGEQDERNEVPRYARNDNENSYGLTVLQSYDLPFLRFLFNYRGHYVDHLSIAETYLAENNFEGALETLSKIYKTFELT